MKKMIKMLTIVLVMIMLVSTSFTIVNAAGASVNPNTFQGNGNSQLVNSAQGLGNTALSTVSTVASVLAVIILIVLGIKYMMGSTEEKAEYKKTLFPYFIGAIFVFGAGAIATWVFNFAGTIVS